MNRIHMIDMDEEGTGDCTVCWQHELVRNNAEDLDVVRAVRRLRPGATVELGGGATPIVRLHKVRFQLSRRRSRGHESREVIKDIRPRRNNGLPMG